MEDWQELLQQHGTSEARPSLPEDGGAPGRSSLMQQVRELVGQTGEAASPETESAVRTEQRVCYPDGYVRRSPVQPYVTPEDYRRRTIRKCVMIAVALAFAVLLVSALLKSKLLSFK